MLYELRTIVEMNFDGVLVPADTVIATVSTDLPISNVLSTGAYGRVAVNKVSDESTLSVTSKAVKKSKHAAKNPDKEPDDPDALNAQDNAEDEQANSNAGNDQSDNTDGNADGNAGGIPAELEPLGTRLANVLMAAGIHSRAALREWLDEGDEPRVIADIDGVGKKAVPQIEKWLAS